MKQEPELIDIFAMIALPAVIRTYKGEDCESAALTAYEYAHAMMEARQKFINSEGERDE